MAFQVHTELPETSMTEESSVYCTNLVKTADVEKYSTSSTILCYSMSFNSSELRIYESRILMTPYFFAPVCAHPSPACELAPPNWLCSGGAKPSHFPVVSRMMSFSSLVLTVALAFLARPSYGLSSLSDLTDDNGESLIFSSRIVGGHSTSASTYPWYATSTGNPTLCGATLIASNLLLSAAHCRGAFTNGVHIGETFFSLQSQQQKVRDGIFVEVKEEIVHPQYNAQTLDFDFMLVVLDDEVSGIPFVQLQLDDNASPRGRQPLEAIGFGLTKENGRQSGTLQSVTGLKTVPHGPCQTLYGDVWNINDPSMLWYVDHRPSCVCYNHHPNTTFKAISNSAEEHVRVTQVDQSWTSTMSKSALSALELGAHLIFTQV